MHDFWPAASNMVAGCCLANPDVISKLNKIAMMELNKCLPGPAKTISDTLRTSTTLEKCEYKKALDFLNRRVKLARNIHGRTYSMHPLRNAFDGVPFGANKHGILVATTEDHLHVCEGTIKNRLKINYHLTIFVVPTSFKFWYLLNGRCRRLHLLTAAIDG
jgi:hypothetical protein